LAIFGEPRPLLIGDSPQIRDLRALIERLGRSSSPVLLLGETGTGKEIVARAIHEVSGSGAFVPIDCSLLGTLLESDLFGHTRGAFTGAVASKPGLLELAAGGTAFFDEIGELPLEIQSKLLRVLQCRQIRPLGSVAERPADFRPIAATNRDLAIEVERGRFRRDLYYRLNVVTLHVPPLRERPEDVRALSDHFLARYSNGQQFTPELHAALENYEWPGNVRELENAIQRMVAVNSGPYLREADLPTALQNSCRGRRASAASASGSLPPAGPVLSLDELEKQAIAEALAFTRGDRGRAAALLGIGRTTLYRKLKSYGL
jgi:DNA-binding NtrC family response regulator